MRSLVCLFLVSLALGCGRRGAGDINKTTEFSDEVGQEKTLSYDLNRVAVENTSTQTEFIVTPQALSYDRKQKTMRLEATHQINHGAVSPSVTYEGALNEASWTAHLKTNSSNSDAMVVCMDSGKCENVVLSVYQNDQGIILKNQFVTKKKPVVEESEYSLEDSTLKPDEVEENTDMEFGEFVVPPMDGKNFDPGSYQAMGDFRGGKLKNATLFPKSGPGFFRIDDHAKMIWGTTSLVEAIINVAGIMTAVYPSRPIIGVHHLSKKFGGPNTHMSHQNGLDGDLVYPSIKTVRDTKWNVLTENGKLDTDFDMERFWHMAKLFNLDGNLLYIFLDQKIKNAVCHYVRKIGEYPKDSTDPNFNTLRVMVHDVDHSDHFHVRLQCPESSVGCHRAFNPHKDTGCSHI